MSPRHKLGLPDKPDWYHVAEFPLLIYNNSHKSECHDARTCSQSGLSGPDHSTRNSWKLSGSVDTILQRRSSKTHCEVLQLSKWPKMDILTSNLSSYMNHDRFSIFLICLYCADTSSLLSGYLVQWVINICGFNVTDHVDYISISYDNESSTSMSSLLIKRLLHMYNSNLSLKNLGIQYITCRKWDPFVCLFIFHYTSFTVSAFTMSSLTIERCAVVYFPYMSITLTDHR